MLKEWLKHLLVVCICISIILSSFNVVFAEDYEKSDSGDDATYYIIEGKDVSDLFDFGIKDVKDLSSWIFQFRTFTVIKKYEDKNGNTQYKMYFNTPNLQSLVKNRVISNISDGYTDDTYKIEDTEWIVKVGQNATSENVITKYGFGIPNYTYMGEYPKATMSMAGILPSSKWWENTWKSIKVLYGGSFISAPDSDNFNTITYLNHTYKGKDDYILEFFKLYYLDYFERQIPINNCANGDTYFSGPEQVIAMAVTEDAYNSAKNYNSTHSDEYVDACQRYEYWNAYQNGGIDACLALNTLVGNRQLDSYHFLASIPKYQTQFENYAIAHPNTIYVLAEASGSDVSSYNITPTSYAPSEDANISLAADIMQYSYDDLQAEITYDVQTRVTTVNSAGKKQTGNWTTTNTKVKDTVTFSEITKWINSDSDYYDNYVAASQSSSSTNKTETRRTNYQVSKIYSTTNKEHSISYDEYKDFYDNCSFNSIDFSEADFVPAELQGIYSAYNANLTTINNYETFIELLNHGENQDDPTSKPELLYRQCLITNEGKDDECWSRKYGDDKTSLSLIHVYAYSKIYTVTENYPESTHELTTADAYEIISKLQSYCGPYYSMVLSNMIKIMCATSKYEGNNEPTQLVISDDSRVMPYDTDTLLAVDRANYDVVDPRVELYKSHTIGKLVSDFTINPVALSLYFKPQRVIIGIAGRITEFSVFMQQMCNFDVLDGFGLSPTYLWTDAYVTLMLGLLALFFIIKTVISIIKMGSNAGTKLIISFFLLVFELGIITAIAANPDKTWNMVKNVSNKLMNLGEMSTVYSTPGLEYLYGDSTDMEVTYYMPYLDLWSKYNTGYGIMDDEQRIDAERDYRELVDIDMPQINNTDIKHWSILLMDSFQYWGQSNSLAYTVTDNGQSYNGPVINNNAYRVVDHFMAPRVNITDNNDKISINVTQNENYNGEFQHGLVDLIVKILNCCLCCFLSLIKMLTFLYFWFMLYIFIFKVILGKGAENKTMGRILLETFSPLIAMIMIGMYSGIVMTIGMNATGLFGIFIELFLFYITFMIVKWWHDLQHGMFFPVTLNWIYMLTNLSSVIRRNQQNQLKNNSEQDAINADMNDGWSDMSLEDQRDELFETGGGPLKQQYATDAKYKKVVENWYERAQRRQTNYANNYIDDTTRRAMNNLELNDKFKDNCAKIKSGILNKQKIIRNEKGMVVNKTTTPEPTSTPTDKPNNKKT